MKKLLCYLLLLILPILMVQTTLYLTNAKGPYWVGVNYDPDYMYLLNSLNLARMKGVGHTDNPGTTVQLTGAIILRVAHLFNISTKTDLQTDVLKNPESYLAVINKVFLGLNTLMLIILGMVTLWLTKNVMVSIIVQLSPFFPGIDSTFIYGLTAVRPESFLLLASLLFMIIIITYANTNNEKINHTLIKTKYMQKLSPYLLFTIFFSVVSGFGMATKVTFIPLLIIPLIILPTYKNKLKYIFGTFLCTVFFTLPIITKYKSFFDSLFSFLTHTGKHGRGSEKILELSLYLTNIKHVFCGNKLFSIILIFSLSILIMSYTIPWFRRVLIGNINHRLLLGVSLSQLMGVMMAAKHFSGWENYYLLPVSSLSGVSLMLNILCLRQISYEFKNHREGDSILGKTGGVILKSNAKLLLLIIVISFLFYSRMTETISFSNGRSQIRNQHTHVYRKAEKDYKNYAKIYYVGSSSPAFALGFGDINARHCNAELLRKFYPRTYLYFFWDGKYYDWDNEVHFEEIVSKHGEEIIFQRPLFNDLRSTFSGIGHPKIKEPDLLLIDVFRENNKRLHFGHSETIYGIDFLSKKKD